MFPWNWKKNIEKKLVAIQQTTAIMIADWKNSSDARLKILEEEVEDQQKRLTKLESGEGQPEPQPEDREKYLYEVHYDYRFRYPESARYHTDKFYNIESALLQIVVNHYPIAVEHCGILIWCNSEHYNSGHTPLLVHSCDVHTVLEILEGWEKVHYDKKLRTWSAVHTVSRDLRYDANWGNFLKVIKDYNRICEMNKGGPAQPSISGEGKPIKETTE